MQMLYQWEIAKDSPARVQELFWSSPARFDSEVLRSFADHLFTGTVRALPQIDGLIQTYAEHWRVERMSAVDRNILRLGVYELWQHRETPAAVVVNEALEIARKFSGEESVQFINGLLDRIRKELETLPPWDENPQANPGPNP